VVGPQVNIAGNSWQDGYHQWGISIYFSKIKNKIKLKIAHHPVCSTGHTTKKAWFGFSHSG
jgi:hypothetical protein